MNWPNIIGFASNLSTLLVLLVLARKIFRMEFKIDLMWAVFSRRYGTRTEKAEDF